MKLLFYKRPKKIIFNLLFILSLISIFLTIISIIVVFLIIYQPSTLNKIDTVIINSYDKKIKDLHTKAKKVDQDKLKYTYYIKLYHELENISIINQYYSYRKEAAQYLINYYTVNKDLNKALSIAETWEKNYPFDLIGKFHYLNIISLVDTNKSSKDYKKFYKRYKDIPEVRDNYISYLMDNSQYDTLFSIVNEDYTLRDIKFQIFYAEKNQSFSQKKSFRYDKKSYLQNQDNFTINFYKPSIRFNTLRFDIENVPQGSILTDVIVDINSTKKTNLKIARVHHIKKLSNSRYQITGKDPYIVYIIPDEKITPSNPISISFSTKVNILNLEYIQILEHDGWKFLVDTGNDFEVNKSIPFILDQNKSQLTCTKVVNYKNATRLRINLPFLKALKLNNFKLILNDNDIYDKKNIASLHNILQNKNNLEVIGSNPYIIINLNKPTNIHKILFNLSFFKEYL